MDLIFGDKLNFRQNDKRLKQKVSNQNILLVTKAVLAEKSDSISQSDGEKKKSVSATSTTNSKGKEGRLLLRDYLYLINKNSERCRQQTTSRDKNELRKVKYKLDEEQIFSLMQEEMQKELGQVIQRLQNMKQTISTRSLKRQDKNNKENIAVIYSIKNIIKDKFKKGIEEINMMVFEEEQRKFQLLNPGENRDGVMKSDNFLEVQKKSMKKKQPKISLQLEKDFAQKENNFIAINGSKFMADFV